MCNNTHILTIPFFIENSVMIDTILNFIHIHIIRRSICFVIKISLMIYLDYSTYLSFLTCIRGAIDIDINS